MSQAHRLRGSTWDHPRGYAPLLVAAEEHVGRTGVGVDFDIRSLQQFADQPLTELVNDYDLIVFDHPFIGEVAQRRLVRPLDGLVSDALIEDLAANSVGASWDSYQWDGHTWALPVDAAFHVSATRPDLLDEGVPTDWADVVELAGSRRQSGDGAVAVPLRAIDVWCLFLTLCATAGDTPFAEPGSVVDKDIGRDAIALLQQLATVIHPGSRDWDPIQLLEVMSRTDEIAYVPALFGYVNYSTTGFRPRLISFDAVPDWNGAAGRPVLGGAGIAVSASSAEPELAAEFVSFVANARTQRTSYVRSGGQAAHRSAWTDAGVNAAVHDFYGRTLASGDRGYLRPRHPGFIGFQATAAAVLRAAVIESLSASAALTAITEHYRLLVHDVRRPYRQET